MTKSDALELSMLDKICFNVPWSEQSFLEECDNKLATYFLAKDNGKIVGYCGFWQVSNEGQVTNIAVLPEYRRCGIASLLIDSMLTELKETEEIFLEVRESNISAISLYEKYGFQSVGKRKNFYHDPVEDGIVMVRRKN